jgi:2-dehydro-3-deoxyphosphogalactonate aldolase
MTADLDFLHAHPLVAILRGVTPDTVLEVAQVLYEAGFRVIEIPLNSPQALLSIEKVHRVLGAQVMVGAGTVLNAEQVDACARAGATLILSPNMNPRVIGRTRERGLLSVPGVATPTEGFDALDAGAHALKMFPADVLGTASIKAWRAVFPPATALFSVGGIGVHNLREFRQAGATGAGLGTSLFVPGLAPGELARRASALLAAWAVGPAPRAQAVSVPAAPVRPPR